MGTIASKVDPLDTIFDQFLTRRQLILNRDILRHDYVPQNLPHRDDQITRLASILAPALNGSKTSNVFIYGNTGTGKTAVARFVVEKFYKKARELDAPLHICYVNCRLCGTNYRVLAEMSKSLGLRVPFTGIAVGELLTRFRNGLTSLRNSMLVVLDEVDALVKNNDEHNLLYELTRINEHVSKSWVGLLGVSNDLHFKEFLDPRALSSLSEEEVVFKPYVAHELYDILSERAAIAFTSGTLSDSSLRLCAALAAGEHGDARRALDLLRVAAELAEREGAPSINDDHVRLAQRKIERDRVVEVLASLPLHSKLLLVCVYLMTCHLPEAFVTGDVYEVYKELCNVAGFEPLTQRRISGLLNELDIMGILNARVVSFGRYGRTKKIRLGVGPKTVAEVLAEDSLVGRLLNHSPQCLQQRL